MSVPVKVTKSTSVRSKTAVSKPTAPKTSTTTRKPRTKKKKTIMTGNYITLNDYFKVETGVYKIMERNIRKGVNTLLLGPTGVGKTELVSNIAKKMSLPLTIFDMGTMSDPIMSLVGTHTIKVEAGFTKSEFVRSRFSEVIQQPGIVLLDELSRASATANNLLFPCLDFRRELSMEYCFDDCTPIKVNKDCVFIATANLGSQYTGTHKLDRALMDRFLLMEIDPLDTQSIKDALHYHTPTVPMERIDKMVEIFNAINKAHDEYTISFNLSIRHLKLVTELVRDGFTLYDSFFTICKGIGGKDGLKSLESILGQAKTE